MRNIKRNPYLFVTLWASGPFLEAFSLAAETLPGAEFWLSSIAKSILWIRHSKIVVGWRFEITLYTPKSELGRRILNKGCRPLQTTLDFSTGTDRTDENGKRKEKRRSPKSTRRRPRQKGVPVGIGGVQRRPRASLGMRVEEPKGCKLENERCFDVTRTASGEGVLRPNKGPRKKIKQSKSAFVEVQLGVLSSLYQGKRRKKKLKRVVFLCRPGWPLQLAMSAGHFVCRSNGGATGPADGGCSDAMTGWRRQAAPVGGFVVEPTTNQPCCMRLYAVRPGRDGGTRRRIW